MTNAQLEEYHQLCSKGYNHWKALGKIFGIIDP